MKSMPPPLSSLSPLQVFPVLHLVIAVGFGPWFITGFARLLLHGSNKQKCNSSKFTFQHVLAEGNSYICATFKHNSCPSVPRRKKQKKDSTKKKSFAFPNSSFHFCSCISRLQSPEAGCRETTSFCKVASCRRRMGLEAVGPCTAERQGTMVRACSQEAVESAGSSLPQAECASTPHVDHLWFGILVTA